MITFTAPEAIVKYITCDSCKNQQYGGLRRKISIHGMVHRFQVCDYKCDAAVMSHVINMVIERYQFDRQETLLVPVVQNARSQETGQGVKVG